MYVYNARGGKKDQVIKGILLNLILALSASHLNFFLISSVYLVEFIISLKKKTHTHTHRGIKKNVFTDIIKRNANEVEHITRGWTSSREEIGSIVEI